MGRPSRYSPEVRERAVRLVFEHEDQHDSQWAAIRSVAEKIGCSSETLRHWVRRAERDQGRRPGLTTDERARLKASVVWALRPPVSSSLGWHRPVPGRPIYFPANLSDVSVRVVRPPCRSWRGVAPPARPPRHRSRPLLDHLQRFDTGVEIAHPHVDVFERKAGLGS